MQSRWFWKNWSLDYRVLGYGLFTLFVASLLFLWYGYIQGPASIISWETFQHQITQESVSHTFELGGFEFSVPIESYITFEYFNGSTITPNTSASYFFLFGVITSSLIILCIITTLDRFWFIVGIALFILFVVSLRLEVVRLFDIPGRTLPLIIISVYVLISFYFNTLRSATPFLFRFLFFSALTGILAILMYFFAGVPYPFLHLATSAYLPGLVLTVIFILMIAHEIMASFIYVTSSGTSSSKSLRHFLLISVIYLANLTLAYMHEARVIDWNFIYIDLYLLFSTSAILGIWGFRHREILYQNITVFNPFGAYMIVALATVAFVTTGMLLGNHNDPALKIIRDAIIFSHLGYGIIFFVYIVSNFMIMMAENLSAWKVLYKPSRMPYFTFRFAGLIATLAFVFYSDWHQYVYHGMSGFYNHLGDLYELMDKNTMAQAYYEQGRSNGFQNNRSNYALGLKETYQNDFKRAHFYYELANGRRPTVFSTVNDGNLYAIEGRYFESIAALSGALQKFPSSDIIANNLGYAYSKIHKLDSALILFDKARGNSMTRRIAESNFMALIANEYLPVKIDSLVRAYDTSSPLALSNALAIASQQNQPLTYPINPAGVTTLDHGTAAQLNNYLVKNVKQLDTATLLRAQRILSDSTNADFSESIKATLAQAFYHQNNVAQAFSTISELAFLSQIMQGKFNYIAGLWALEQGCPELAIRYFDFAVMFDYKEARLYNAIAMTEAGFLNEALPEIDSLLVHPNAEVQTVGRQLKKIITLSPAQINSLNDLEKYQYCRYRISTRDTLLFDRIIATIQITDFKVSALLEMAQRQYDMGNTRKAISYLEQTSGLAVIDKKIIDRINFFELTLLTSQNALTELANRINDGIEFTGEKELERLLYQAQILEVNGDSTAAEKNYRILAAYNPFFEEGIIASAAYYKKHSDDDMKAYAILAEAIQVNTTSYRLWMAYIKEALNVGFDSQAADAMEQAAALKSRK